jgi:hypothetical protein
MTRRKGQKWAVNEREVEDTCTAVFWNLATHDLGGARCPKSWGEKQTRERENVSGAIEFPRSQVSIVEHRLEARVRGADRGREGRRKAGSTGRPELREKGVSRREGTNKTTQKERKSRCPQGKDLKDREGGKREEEESRLAGLV